MRKLRFTAVAAIAASAALALAACSGGSLSGNTASSEPNASGASEAPAEMTKITVGLLPIAPAAAVQYGIDKGIFKKNGLDVTIQLGQGGAALLPAVSSGQIQFAVGNPLSVLTAASKGLDMNIVSGYSQVTEPAPSGIVVKSDSGIKTWKDLEGKTVALNALKTQGDLTTMAQVKKDGGDPTKVTFTEIPFPDQQAQLEQGRIDASWVPEPFLSRALGTDGIEFLGDPLAYIPNLYTMVGFTSGDYASKNPMVVEEFRKAITESLAAATADEAGYRDTIVTFTKGDPATVAKIRLEKLDGALDPNIITQLSDLAVEYKFIETAPDLNKVILQ